MRYDRILAFGTIAVLLLTAVVGPAWSDDDDDDGHKISGVIVAFDPGGSFRLRQLRTNYHWLIVFHRKVDIDDGGKRKGGVLRLGDIVEVKGKVLERGTLLARKIKVVAYSGPAPVGPVVVQPVQPAPPPPVVAQPPSSNPAGSTVLAIVKTIGVGAAVRAFAPAINNFINTLLQNRGAAVQAQTKVVPILSVAIGIQSPGGAYIGAAQVSGPATAVTRVQAVAQIEADYQQAFRVKVLVPVDNLKPWEAFRRVPGVGVSAIIDLRI